MKKQLRSLMLLAFLLTVLLPFNAVALKHIVNVQNFSFSPSNINNVQIGDTIRWVWVSGVHTTTSTSVPAGAATWNSPITSTVTSYEYPVTVAGSYSYVCTPHAGMGMTGTFTVVGGATLNVTPSNRDVPATAGSTTFSVTSNSNWTAVSNQPWCTVTSSGSGNGTITANYAANTVTSQRIATITVTVSGLPSQLVTVTQAGAAATLSVQPPNQDVASTSGSTSFSVVSNSSWTANSDQPWCTVTASGSGNGTITANYAANTVTSQRIATITVMVSGLPSQMVTVTQAGAAATLSVQPPNQDVASTSGSTTFSVVSNSDWTASSNQSWCTVNPSGSGNGTITANYAENTSVEPRVANITVTVNGIPSETVTVSQAGAEPTLLVGPSDQIVSYESGSVDYLVTSNTDWLAQSDTEWCTVTPSGTGDGTIVATYSENTTADSRVTIITVSVSGIPDEMVTLSQGGAPISVKEVNPPALRIFPNPASSIFTVDLNGKVTGDALLSILTMKGEVVFEKLINQGSGQSFDITPLPSGTYITKVISGNNTWQERLVIVR